MRTIYFDMIDHGGCPHDPNNFRSKQVIETDESQHIIQFVAVANRKARSDGNYSGDQVRELIEAMNEMMAVGASLRVAA